MLKHYCFALFCGLTTTLATAQTDRAALVREFQQLDSVCYTEAEDNLPLVLRNSKRMREIGQQCQLDSMVVEADYLEASAMAQLGAFDAALKIAYNNLALAEQRHDCKSLVRFPQMIGTLYQSMSDWSQSQVFMYKARQNAINCGLLLDTITINYEIGFNKVAQGDQTGYALLERNLEVAKRLRRNRDILLGIDNLSNMVANDGDYQRALEIQLELLKMPEIWPGNFEKSVVHEHLAEIYVLLKNWERAQYHQRETLKYATLVGSNDWLFECYKLQSMIDEGQGNYQSALLNHQRYLALKDSVYQSQYDEKMAAMSALYELDAKQKAIALLEKDKQIQQDQLQQQRTLLLVGLLVVGLIILSILLFNQRKTQRLRAAFAQDLLKAQENERQRIARELHDSVGQNILFVKNRLQRLGAPPDSQLADSVDQALEEVRSIAKDLYPNQLEQYGLSAAVESLCEMAQESSGVFVSSDLEGVDQQLSREAKINCYRIIQECLNNALKHAGATAIRITSTLQAGRVELVVQDNGRGFDRNLLERKSVRSFGLINIEERVRMLRGRFELETAANKGVKLTFAIPAAA